MFRLDYHFWNLLEEICGRIVDVPGSLLEIGCHKCGVTAYLANTFPNRDVFAFDRFEQGLSELNPQYDMKETQSYHEGVQASNYVEVREWLNSVGLERVNLIKGDIRKTLMTVKVNQIAFCLIDLNLYEPTRYALNWSLPKMSPNGIICMDDIAFPGVKAAAAELDPQLKKREEGGKLIITL